MTPRQREQANALALCSMLPGSTEKRFARDMAARNDTVPLTAKQAFLLERLAWRFRRQMPAHLVPSEKPA